ncbi:MAG: hypothetical protein WC623_22430 [Pedobacter sp.]|uniref:hypothetical protein n=1 Tax=Pedobacter sp. TaxID=1411316 RepID=UPI003568F236
MNKKIIFLKNCGAQLPADSEFRKLHEEHWLNNPTKINTGMLSGYLIEVKT